MRSPALFADESAPGAARAPRATAQHRTSAQRRTSPQDSARAPHRAGQR